MGRLRVETLERVEAFADRALDVVDAVDKPGRSGRILEQASASGTSVGANIFEADEAMSRKDVCKTLAIANKVISETQFWLRLFARRGWVKSSRLEPLLLEATELKRIFGAMRSRTQKAS